MSLFSPSNDAAKSDMQRAAVVAAARAWIGTPYHHMADIKGAGVDCAMLLVRVYCDLGLVSPFDPRPYTQDWMMHRNEERYLGFLLERARIVAKPDAGDVILFKIGRCFAHGGIVTRTEPLTICHAFMPAGYVIEDEIARSAELSERLTSAKFASYWGSA
jgi:cell wall-associated NlpC family hydrolase